MEDERGKKRHPIQPLGSDERGILRFKPNKIVQRLLDDGPFNMNTIAVWAATGEVTRDDMIQFAQLVGYSFDGFRSLTYVDDETCAAAGEEDEHAARLEYYIDLVNTLKTALREPIAELYECHPDDLMEVEE